MVQEKNIVRLGLTIIMFIALLGLVNTPALAHRKHVKRACSQTASTAFLACQYEVKDDYWIARGNCYNAKEDQAECFGDAKAEYKEAEEECRDQLEARKEVCEELGEAPYDPQLDPEGFVGDPTTITASNANRYFPLVPGTVWVYQTIDEEDNLLERITVTVTGDIKEIEYPAESDNIFYCAVVHDVVEEYDDDTGTFSVIEDTYDWYAQKINGDVWYFGEISLEFEDGELVGTEGSWKSGVEGAKPGILMYASPDPDNEDQANPYRQEFFLGDAEDVGEVLSIGEAVVEVPYGIFRRRVLKTRDFTPIEPDVFEYKYYAPGVGVILEEAYEDDMPTGERVELKRFASGS